VGAIHEDGEPISGRRCSVNRPLAEDVLHSSETT
jgi:hypothetical protein